MNVKFAGVNLETYQALAKEGGHVKKDREESDDDNRYEKYE